MDDIPQLLSLPSDSTLTTDIKKQIHEITHELFSAFENEYTIFAPMSNCFELFGLDFLVEENVESLQVSLLEVNPGPDFKQTGSKLKTVIENLIEETLQLVVDPIIIATNIDSSSNPSEELSNVPSLYSHVTPNMSLVYDKEWSVSRMQGGMQFK